MVEKKGLDVEESGGEQLDGEARWEGEAREEAVRARFRDETLEVGSRGEWVFRAGVGLDSC